MAARDRPKTAEKSLNDRMVLVGPPSAGSGVLGRVRRRRRQRGSSSDRNAERSTRDGERRGGENRRETTCQRRPGDARVGRLGAMYNSLASDPQTCSGGRATIRRGMHGLQDLG